jgi:hypothetical protein
MPIPRIISALPPANTDHVGNLVGRWPRAMKYPSLFSVAKSKELCDLLAGLDQVPQWVQTTWQCSGGAHLVALFLKHDPLEAAQQLEAGFDQDTFCGHAGIFTRPARAHPRRMKSLASLYRRPAAFRLEDWARGSSGPPCRSRIRREDLHFWPGTLAGDKKDSRCPGGKQIETGHQLGCEGGKKCPVPSQERDEKRSDDGIED